MGVVVKLRGLTDLGRGRWEYRKRIPAAAQSALGKTERKAVIEARSDKELMRKYVVVVAKIDAEIAAAKAPAAKLTPRATWEVALQKADSIASDVVGTDDPDEARELVAEDLVSRGKATRYWCKPSWTPEGLPQLTPFKMPMKSMRRRNLGLVLGGIIAPQSFAMSGFWV
ncbi:MAG: hypothetical protein ABJQ70_14085 [Roseobacter sp.]